MLINGSVQIEDMQTRKSAFSRFVLCNFHLGMMCSQNSLHKLDSKEPRLVLVTCNKTIKYKLLGNIKSLNTREFRNGKISFVLNEPNHCVMVSCEDEKTKFRQFVQLLHKLSDKKKFVKLERAPIIPLKLKYVHNNSKSSNDGPSEAEKSVARKLFSTMGVINSTLTSIMSRSLQVVCLANCNVKRVPREFGKLSWVDVNLENTGIRNCDLQWLEESPIRKSMKKLNLSKNKISIFPSALVEFQGLETLNLCDNAIENIPGTIGSLRCLRYFNISQNRLQYLPFGIEDLVLHDLNLAENDLNSTSRYELRTETMIKNQVSRLEDLAAVHVDPILRGQLTSEDCPPMLLDKLRRLSKCICNKRSVPYSSTQYFTLLTGVSFTASYCFYPQRYSSSNRIFLQCHLHANANTCQSYMFQRLKSQSRIYR